MSRTFNRRDLLKGLGGAAGLAALGAGELRTALAADAGSDAVWKQASGTTLNFISENTPPTSAIAADLEPFKELTGINVNVTQLKLGNVTQKVALDFGAGRSAYQVIYADPYNIMAPYHAGLADLNQFIDDDSLPSVPKGLDDFIPTQLAADGRFGNRKQLYTLPFDCPTVIWIYRKDLFDKYREPMAQDLGFDPTPSDRITWQQYYQIARWFNGDRVGEVAYGTGHMAQQYVSLMMDFTDVLFAYGGSYFKNGHEVGLIGTAEPGECILTQDAGVQAAAFYKKLLDVAHPGSTSWDWTGVANAFKNGEIAMMPDAQEFASMLESSELRGKIGYAPLPTGPQRSANIYGGTGIGINANAPAQQQKAAWLFLVWATSPQTQLAGLKSDVGGGTPTRTSVYNMPEVQNATELPSDMLNMLPTEAMMTAWQDDHIALRPKIPQWSEVQTIIWTQLSKMLADQQGPEQTMQRTKTKIDQVLGV